MKQLILSTCMSGLLFASGGCSRLLDSKTGDWEVQEDVSPLDDSRNVFMFLSAENKVGLTRPTLVVRCMEGETHVFINYDSVLGRPGYDVTVLTRFDQHPAEESRWIVSTDGTAIFAYGGVGWAHEIASARKLFVRVIPESGRAVDATFQLKGAEEAMRPLRKACGWVACEHEATALLSHQAVAFARSSSSISPATIPS